MKRYTLTLFTLLVLTTISFGQLKFGAGVSLLDVEFFGVQGKALMDLEEATGQPLDGAATFTYYFNEVIDWSIDLDAHYRLLTFGEDIALAPLAGLQIARAGFAGIGSTDIGLNLGANFTIPLESFTLYAQPKLIFGGFDSFTIAAGILF